ncbi:MAG TPA: hypothetical protein VGH37_07460 [Candidatus Acidoferrum sp.]
MIIKSAAILFGVVFIAIGNFGFIKEIAWYGQNLVNVASGLAALLCGMRGVGASRSFFRIYGTICALVALLGFYYFGVVQVRASRRADQLMLNASEAETPAIQKQILDATTKEEHQAALVAPCGVKLRPKLY